MFSYDGTMTRARLAILVAALLAHFALEAYVPELEPDRAGQGADLDELEGQRQAALELERLAQ